MRTPAAVTLVLLLAAPAAAQRFSPTQRVLFSEGTLRGSPRLMGIAGAYVGLAEDVEGVPRNPASIAAKFPTFDGDLHWDGAGTMHFLPVWATRQQDWDNDGRPEQAAALPFDFLGTQVFYSFGSVQYKDFAAGGGWDMQNFLIRHKVPGDRNDYLTNLSLWHLYGTIAGSFWKDQILVGLGIESSHAFLGYAVSHPGDVLPSVVDSMGFHGWGLQLGAVWRPENADWRVGVSYKPEVTATPYRARETFAGMVAPAAVCVPGRLSLGGALALGNGRHLNITSPAGWVSKDSTNPPPPTFGSPDSPVPKGSGMKVDDEKPAPPPTDGPPPQMTSAMTKWLFTFQLDVYFPVSNATLVSPFLEQPDVDAVGAGYHLSFEPRLGIEKEVFADLLRIRGGTYLEPAVTATSPLVRPHVTFGFEVALFKLGKERTSFGLSFDFAPMYQNLSIAILVWK